MLQFRYVIFTKSIVSFWQPSPQTHYQGLCHWVTAPRPQCLPYISLDDLRRLCGQDRCVAYTAFAWSRAVYRETQKIWVTVLLPITFFFLRYPENSTM